MSIQRCLICGMIVNHKNMRLNEEGMLNKNEADIINSCPFCGVDKTYMLLSDDEAEETKDIENLDNITIKILDHAMKLEVFNSEFYGQAAILAKDDKNKKMFTALSKIELIHAKVHQRIAGYKMLPAITTIDYSKYNDDNILLNQAALREAHAVSYYKKHCENLCSNYIKIVFEALCKVEEEHIALTAL